MSDTPSFYFHTVGEQFEIGETETRVTKRYWPNGSLRFEEYTFNGRPHREDGPAWVKFTPDGVKIEELYYRYGNGHRDGGEPAGLHWYDDGSLCEQRWIVNGSLHREDGPAIIEYGPDGIIADQEFWLDGVLIDQEVYEQYTFFVSAGFPKEWAKEALDAVEEETVTFQRV